MGGSRSAGTAGAGVGVGPPQASPQTTPLPTDRTMQSHGTQISWWTTSDSGPPEDLAERVAVWDAIKNDIPPGALDGMKYLSFQETNLWIGSAYVPPPTQRGYGGRRHNDRNGAGSTKGTRRSSRRDRSSNARSLVQASSSRVQSQEPRTIRRSSRADRGVSSRSIEIRAEIDKEWRGLRQELLPMEDRTSDPARAPRLLGIERIVER